MVPQWQIDRGQLNHNWLQNGVLIALNHALGVTDETVRPRDVARTLAEDIDRWPERSADLSSLVDRFETEMSPKIYFDFPPLSRCPAETREWLMPLTHELWLQRVGVREKTLAAKTAYGEADKAYVAAVSALAVLPKVPAPNDLHLMGTLLLAFIGRCTTLAEAISALPQRVICC